MRMKCPVCGSEMMEVVPNSGNLLQRYSGQYACTKCSYKTKTEDEMLSEALRKIERNTEAQADG